MQDYDPTRFEKFCIVAGCPKLPRAYRVGFRTLASCIGVASEKRLLAAVAVVSGFFRPLVVVVATVVCASAYSQRWLLCVVFDPQDC